MVLLYNQFMSVLISAPRPILETLIDKYDGFTSPVPIRVAVGTYNINGGKHFRSIVYKDVSLSDWLLDAHKQKEAHGKCITVPIVLVVTTNCPVGISTLHSSPCLQFVLTNLFPMPFHTLTRCRAVM